MMRTRIHFSRFDRAVALALLAFGLLSILVIWRGDRIGVQVVAQSPEHGATDVSTLTSLRLTFSQALTEDAAAAFSIEPPVDGNSRWQGRTLIFEPENALQPGTEYVASVPAGLSGENGQQLLNPVRWVFHTRPSRVLYLGPAADDYEQIFLATLGQDGSPRQLTTFTRGIWDYALSPDGASVAVAAIREDGANDLWLVDVESGATRQIVACEEGNCTGPDWSPDGRTIMYERQGFLGPPRLWWVDIVSGEEGLVFDDTQMIGFAGRWSPNGEWINHVAPLQGVRIYNVQQGEEIIVQSEMGEAGVWSPDSASVIFGDVRLVGGENFNVHLFRVDLATGEVLDISGEEEGVEDTSPTWSPDGEWIAFGRKLPRVAVGSQLWLMRPDGSEARALTEEFDVHHGPAAWSADGRSLVFQRFDLKEMGAKPSIWIMDITTGEMKELAGDGRMPVWAP